MPPFGAHGRVFNKNETALFNDTVVKIPVALGSPGPPGVFANSVNGADGLIIDDDDNIWVAANQADEIVVLVTTHTVSRLRARFPPVQDLP